MTARDPVAAILAAIASRERFPAERLSDPEAGQRMKAISSLPACPFATWGVTRWVGVLALVFIQSNASATDYAFSTDTLTLFRDNQQTFEIKGTPLGRTQLRADGVVEFQFLGDLRFVDGDNVERSATAPWLWSLATTCSSNRARCSISRRGGASFPDLGGGFGGDFGDRLSQTGGALGLGGVTGGAAGVRGTGGPFVFFAGQPGTDGGNGANGSNGDAGTTGLPGGPGGGAFNNPAGGGAAGGAGTAGFAGVGGTGGLLLGIDEDPLRSGRYGERGLGGAVSSFEDNPFFGEQGFIGQDGRPGGAAVPAARASQAGAARITSRATSCRVGARAAAAVRAATAAAEAAAGAAAGGGGGGGKGDLLAGGGNGGNGGVGGLGGPGGDGGVGGEAARAARAAGRWRSSRRAGSSSEAPSPPGRPASWARASLPARAAPRGSPARRAARETRPSQAASSTVKSLASAAVTVARAAPAARGNRRPRRPRRPRRGRGRRNGPLSSHLDRRGRRDDQHLRRPRRVARRQRGDGRYVVAFDNDAPTDLGAATGARTELFSTGGVANPYIEGGTTRTSNVPGLRDGADAYGVLDRVESFNPINSFDAFFDGVRANAPEGAIAAVVRAGSVPGLPQIDDQDVLLLVNLTASPLDGAGLGVVDADSGSGFTRRLSVQGFFRNPTFGGGGPLFLPGLPGNAVFATLAPDNGGIGEAGVNVATLANGVQRFNLTDSDLPINDVGYLSTTADRFDITPA